MFSVKASPHKAQKTSVFSGFPLPHFPWKLRHSSRHCRRSIGTKRCFSVKLSFSSQLASLTVQLPCSGAGNKKRKKKNKKNSATLRLERFPRIVCTHTSNQVSRKCIIVNPRVHAACSKRDPRLAESINHPRCRQPGIRYEKPVM